MQGHELLRVVRKARPDLPVIFITGYPETLSRLPAPGIANHRCFSKPFQGSELLAAVRESILKSRVSGFSETWGVRCTPATSGCELTTCRTGKLTPRASSPFCSPIFRRLGHTSDSLSESCSASLPPCISSPAHLVASSSAPYTLSSRSTPRRCSSLTSSPRSLLYAQFSILRSRAILVIASGYLFTAILIIPYLLAFPGVLAPNGVVGGLQASAHLYLLWHCGFPIFAIGYALSKDEQPGRKPSSRKCEVVDLAEHRIDDGRSCGGSQFSA